MFRQHRSRAVGALVVIVVFGGVAHATPFALSDSFIQLDDSGPNDISAPVGFGIFLGTNVVPFGLAGASTTGSATMGPVSILLPFKGTTADPGGYNKTISDTPGNRGQWTLTFTNGPDTVTQTVSLPPGATQLPLITNLAIGGSPANPTFSWLPPAGRAVEGYRINLFDQGLRSKSNTFQDVVLTGTVTSPTFTVPTALAGGLTLDPTHRYTIQINALENRDGSGNLSNANVIARSRAYFDFTPTPTGGPTFVYLPVPGPNGRFDYNVTNVAAGTTIFVDPPVAIGYDYATGTGNPNFRTVVLPSGIGDNMYDIYGLNALGQHILLANDWLGGQVFDFGVAGVDWFEVLGIEASADIDPADTTAFVTGLSFVSGGDFTGSQTPITEEVGVPEPSVTLLFAVGVIGLLRLRGRPTPFH